MLLIQLMAINDVILKNAILGLSLESARLLYFVISYTEQYMCVLLRAREFNARNMFYSVLGATGIIDHALLNVIR